MKTRTPFEQAVRHGWFAVIYWTALGIGLVAVVLGVWGSVEQRIVTGACVAIGLVLLIIGRYYVAHQIQKKLDRQDS